MSDHCHHPNPYCPSCVDPIAADDRIRLFPPPQKVFSAAVLAQYEAKVRELELEAEQLRGENERLVNDVRGLERFRDLRTRHNDEMERKQSAMNRALSALESGDYGSAFAALRNAL